MALSTGMDLNTTTSPMPISFALAELREPENSKCGWKFAGIRFDDNGHNPTLMFARGEGRLDIHPTAGDLPLRAIPHGESEDYARNPRMHGINPDACAAVFDSVDAAITLAPLREAAWITDLCDMAAAR